MTRRRYLTPKAKADLWKRQDKRCAKCARTIKYVQDRIIEADHMCPLWCGGDNADDNWQLLCRPCHAAKTNRESKARGKTNRLAGGPKKRRGRAIPSRPFDKFWRKPMNGRVEVRT